MHPGVKVFVGNVPEETSQVELRDLFEAAEPGEVLKVALMKQFAFVHLRDEAAAERAIHKLNGHLLHGHRVVVEHSRPRPTHTVKIFVGNVSAACTSGELRVLFQEFGPVVECDIVKDYAFVHMEKDEDARAAIEHLNGREIKGKRINVELSNKAHKRGPAGHLGQLGGGAEKSKISTLEKLQPRNDGLRTGNLAFPMATPGAYSSLDYDYQQRLSNNNLTKFDSNGQARQVSPSFFGRDRSPLRRSPTRAGYALPMAAQQASYRDQPAASLGMAYRPQPTTGQAAVYRAQPSTVLGNAYRAQTSVSMGPSGAQTAAAAAASAMTPYTTQAYGTQATASQVASYEAQPATTYAASYGAQAAATYAASYGAQAAALSASYGAQTAASQSALYTAHTLSAQPASYGVQPAVGHAASYGAQAASALPAAYGTQSAANLAAAYSMQDAAAAAAAASYKTQLSASLPTAYRATGEAAYAAQQSAAVPVAAGYRAQATAYNGLAQSAQQAASYQGMSQAEAAVLHPLYERTRLSPPRGSREDLYRKAAAMNKRYNSDLSDDRRLSDLSDFRRLTDSPHAYRHSPTKAQLDYRRLPEMQSDARYAGAYGDYLRNAQLQLHASYQRRL